MNYLSDIYSNLAKLNYREYCLDNQIHTLPDINVNLDEYGEIQTKTDKKWETIDPHNKVPSPAELDDLVRLHWLVRNRKVRTIMEFGVGKSTSVMLDAISRNKNDYSTEVSEKLRLKSAFEVHSIDNNVEWMNRVISVHSGNELFKPHVADCRMGTFNDRACTYYDEMPNLRPDFIYLDGPDQFSIKDSVRGISTAHADRMPMAADILVMEHFLEPGTMILVDGRTANARFLKVNFQRNWSHLFMADFDQHLFLLDEPPLGKWNKAALDFSTTA